MARTNLAYLNDAVHQALERQIENPHAPKDVAASAVARAQKRIAGIEVIDTGVIESHRDERRAALENHRRDATELKQKLDAAGVKYLTIWPTRAWEAVCKEHPLFTLAPDENGAVRVNTAWLKGVADEAKRALEAMPLAAFLSGGIVAAVSVVSVVGFGWIALALSAAAFFAGGYAVGKTAEFFVFDDGKPLAGPLAMKERSLIRRMLRQPHDTIMRMLLPENREVKGGVPLPIDLPPAPEDVQTNLIKAMAAGFVLTLHTVPEAISFRGNPVEAFVKLRQPHYEQLKKGAVQRKEAKKLVRAARWQAFHDAWRDPIVTTSHGSATAIIAQYGEFPVEKELVDRVLNSSALI